MIASVLVRPNPDMILRQLQDQLIEALTPERYDLETAKQAQRALAAFREQSNRYRRMRRAALTVSTSDREWWY